MAQFCIDIIDEARVNICKFLNVLSWKMSKCMILSNGQIVRVPDSLSMGLEFKTTGWLQG